MKEGLNYERSLTEGRKGRLERKPTTLMKNKGLNQQGLRALPEFSFRELSSSGLMWSAFTRQVLNDDIHVEKDPNYVSFFENFDIEAVYHSVQIEKAQKKKKVEDYHLDVLKNVDEFLDRQEKERGRSFLYQMLPKSSIHIFSGSQNLP